MTPSTDPLEAIRELAAAEMLSAAELRQEITETLTQAMQAVDLKDDDAAERYLHHAYALMPALRVQSAPDFAPPTELEWRLRASIVQAQEARVPR